MVPVTIAIQGCEHDTEWSSPLAEKDEEMVPKAVLREEETSMMHYETRRGEVFNLKKIIYKNINYTYKVTHFISASWATGTPS